MVFLHGVTTVFLAVTIGASTLRKREEVTTMKVTVKKVERVLAPGPWDC
jgi:hypothetical protein